MPTPHDRSESNVLLLADSDMLYHPNWLQTLDRLLPHLHGVVRAASRRPYLHLTEYDIRQHS